MATTTNYGWTTPDDTDLVKDGAAAIRTLGSSVDTTTKNLNPETTLGDIAYRSSTANVKTRLGLGTAGQVLTVNSGANAPEWATPATPASGLTFITSTTFTNSTGANIDSIFSSSYENYLVILDDLAGVGGGAYVGMQFRYGSTTQTTEYYTVNFGYNVSDALETNGKSAGATYVVARVHTSATSRSSAHFFVSNVGNASEWATVRGQFSNGEGTHMGVFGGRVNAQNYTGIRLLPDPTVGGGSNISGRVTVYGLAKA
jgi:hypothetical protein